MAGLPSGSGEVQIFATILIAVAPFQASLHGQDGQDGHISGEEAIPS
jgi:hypothetical protein